MVGIGGEPGIGIFTSYQLRLLISPPLTKIPPLCTVAITNRDNIHILSHFVAQLLGIFLTFVCRALKKVTGSGRRDQGGLNTDKATVDAKTWHLGAPQLTLPRPYTSIIGGIFFSESIANDMTPQELRLLTGPLIMITYWLSCLPDCCACTILHRHTRFLVSDFGEKNWCAPREFGNVQTFHFWVCPP